MVGMAEKSSPALFAKPETLAELPVGVLWFVPSAIGTSAEELGALSRNEVTPERACQIVDAMRAKRDYFCSVNPDPPRIN
jgi:hypothetical protein